MTITKHRRRYVALAVAALSTSFLVSYALAAVAGEMRFEDVRRQTAEFIGFHKSIRLSAAQQTIYQEALEALPAPCCSDNSAYTCCCPCNAARAWWGLSKHLIADLDYDVEQVKEKVNEWFVFTNPKGYSGDICYTGGCGRSFANNGCGGMSESSLVF